MFSLIFLTVHITACPCFSGFFHLGGLKIVTLRSYDFISSSLHEYIMKTNIATNIFVSVFPQVIVLDYLL